METQDSTIMQGRILRVNEETIVMCADGLYDFFGEQKTNPESMK
jgi:hypothetical protein